MAVSRHIRAARWGGALLVALAPLPWLGMGAAQAADAVVYATVTGHEAFSPEANQADYWGDDCEKIVDGGSLGSYVLTQDYALVVVKAASRNVDPYTNTLFENASAGETVWADTNGNFTFDPGGKDGDKAISHIIVCNDDDASTPPVSSSAPASSSEEPTPSESESTDEPSPSESESTDEPSPSESESTDEPSPSESESSSEPVSSEPEPSESEFSSSPGEVRSSTPNEPGPTETASSGAAALPKTGAGTPVAGAIGISLLLIGVGILLLLGPGRLIPATYHRKH